METLKPFLQTLIAGQDLSVEQMRDAMCLLVEGQCDAVQAGAFLTCLAQRGESVEALEVTADVLLERCIPVDAGHASLLDTCGTGGDGVCSFNVSSATAIVAAAAGARVAKHGNRSVSSSCGSADLFEKAGLAIDLDAQGVAKTLEAVGIAFLFAPIFHPALAQLAPVRKALGVRTVFNLLGPLVNPARPSHRLVGVFDKRWLVPMAKASVATGAQRVLVVHSDDGMDEVSIAAPTTVVEIAVEDGAPSPHRQFEITPQQFGMGHHTLEELRVKDADHSLQVLNAVLAGEQCAAYDAVTLNAGVALYVAEQVEDVASGVEAARAAIAQGRAAEKFQHWVERSQAIKEEGHAG